MKFNKSALVAGMILATGLSTGCTTTQTTEKEVIRQTSHLDMCLMYANQQDYQNAIRECKIATEQQPSAGAYSNLGAAYVQVGKNNLAMDAMQKAKSMSPNDPFVNYNLATLYSLMDQTDRALESLDTALANGFNNYDSLRFDKDLNNVRGEPEFRKVLEKHNVFIQ